MSGLFCHPSPIQQKRVEWRREKSRLIFFPWTVGMTNVGGLITPEGVLRDVRSMIPNPLQGASNEDYVHVAWQKFRVHGRPRDELFADVPRHRIRCLAKMREMLDEENPDPDPADVAIVGIQVEKLSVIAIPVSR